jgi:microcystin-dependent protein
MALETATYINGLVQTNPLGSDPLADADGHLRLIKSTLKATFPNITGPVTAAQGALNSPFPAGGIIMWSGSTGSIPSGWLLCNGANDTPDLRDRFIIGSGGTFATGATGGSTTISAANLPAHTHTLSTDGSHTHTVTDPGHTHSYTAGDPVDSYSYLGSGQSRVRSATFTTASSTTGISIVSGGAHTHTVGSTGSGTAYYPPYYALAFIMKSAY